MRKAWTKEQKALLASLYQDTKTSELAVRFNCSESAIYAQAHLMQLKKTVGYLQSELSGRIQKHQKISVSTQFKKGSIPHNKGVKGWQAGGNASKSRFKPGQKPHNYKPIGSERFSKEGYLQRKMTDTGYPPKDWVPVHHLLWRDHHGEIPKGFIVIFKNGDKSDIRLDNLKLISQKENMQRNTIHRFPEELVQVMRLKSKVTRKINARLKNGASDEKQN